MNGEGRTPPGPLLDIRRLTTAVGSPAGLVRAVDDVSLDVRPGETVGLVGESGCGKSMTALSVLRLVPPPGRIVGGAVVFRGRDLLALSDGEMGRVRGAQIAFIPQEPAAALNPVFPIGDQIAETMLVHGKATRADMRARAIAALAAVGMPYPSARARDYPHQLSGGMRQRALIAMAICCRPSLVIADEPTTALDVTLQAQVLDLWLEMQQTFQLSLLLIAHDLGVVAGAAGRVAVMYAGRVVETGPVRAVFHAPLHPYTQGLLASVPGVAPGGRLRTIEGVVPSLAALPGGCAFAPRCPERLAVCEQAPPRTTRLGEDRSVRCYLHGAERS